MIIITTNTLSIMRKLLLTLAKKCLLLRSPNLISRSKSPLIALTNIISISPPTSRNATPLQLMSVADSHISRKFFSTDDVKSMSRLYTDAGSIMSASTSAGKIEYSKM